jgi:hypothetical protein
MVCIDSSEYYKSNEHFSRYFEADLTEMIDIINRSIIEITTLAKLVFHLQLFRFKFSAPSRIVSNLALAEGIMKRARSWARAIIDEAR